MSRKRDPASISNVGLSRHETSFFAEKEMNDIRHFLNRSGSGDGGASIIAFRFSAARVLIMSVSIKLGARQLMRMLGASASEQLLTKPITPAFEAL